MTTAPESPDSPQSPEKESRSRERVNAKAVGVIGLAVGCSRVLGLVREMVMSRLFGAGIGMDAFLTAFRVPNLLRDLFAEGALSTAFITTFSKKIEKEGVSAAWELASKVATLATVFISVLVLLGMVFAPFLVSVIAGGFSPEKAALTVWLTRLMFPFILLISLSALAMGMLNSRNVFGIPALASSFFNMGSIVGGVALAYWLDPTFGVKALTGLALGTLVGGAMQLLVQFPALWKVGFRFRPNFLWRDDGVRQILYLMGPAVVAASAVQVNVMVNARFASFIPGDGPVSWLGYAFRLMMLPLGLFGVAAATATLPVLSRCAGLGDMEGVRAALARGMRLAFLLTIPAAVGLMMLAEPIISLLYANGGKFGYNDTIQTAAALRFYAMGLVAYAGIKVLAPAFYAIDRRNLPMLVGFFSIATNYGLNWLFTHHLGWGHRGLAFSTSLVALINFGLLYGLMNRAAGHLDQKAVFNGVVRPLFATVPLVFLCYGAQVTVFADLQTMRFWEKLWWTGATVGAGFALFAFGVFALKVEEAQEVAGMFRRKLGRFFPGKRE